MKAKWISNLISVFISAASAKTGLSPEHDVTLRSQDTQSSNVPKIVISRHLSVNLIMMIYFVSGMCSLIDEVVWTRLFKLILGNTVYASSIVVSLFLGGLALGALIMGRYCDRVKRHLRLYALLESLITISALSLPWILKLADPLYVWFYQRYHPSQSSMLIVQAAISAAILLIPSIMMGSTLPLLGRFVTSIENEAGHLVGRLYALNTLGAAAGCFGAGFILIRTFGIMGTLYIAAALNLFAAFGGWLLSRFSGVPASQEDSAASACEAADAKTGDRKFYLLAAAFFASGFISISYELLWMRSIVHLLGGFTYVFSAVLTVYLLGNVIGAGISSWFVKRLKVPARGFAVSLMFLGICGVVYIPFLILWSSDVVPMLIRELGPVESWTPLSPYLVAPIVHSVVLFLLPSIVMGIGFPIGLQAWTNCLHKVGRSTGMAYGVNSIGAVMGGIATGFVFIPFLGLRLSISMLGLAGMWMAGIMYLYFSSGFRSVGRWAVPAVGGILTIFTLQLPSNLLSVVVKADSIIPLSKTGSIPPDGEVVALREGVATTISVIKDLDKGTLSLWASGRRIAGDAHFYRGDQKILGHFGALLNSRAKKILSVGFGSGESTACLAMHELERVDCVEIAPEVVDISLEFFRHINLGDRLYEKVNMIFMDAKNYVHLTEERYDAIVSDSINPRYFAENASLYAKEYFESAKDRLNEGGLFISWIPSYHVVPVSEVNSIVGTAMEVYPHVTIWYMITAPGAYFVIACSEEQQYFSPSHIERELSRIAVRQSLSEIDINNSMDVLSCYLGDERDLKKFIREFSLNSDYSPFVEFNTDSEPGGNPVSRKFGEVVESKSVYDHIDLTDFTEEQKGKWLADYELVRRAMSRLLKAHNSDNYLERLQHIAEGLNILPDNPALLRYRSNADSELLSILEKLILKGQADYALEAADDILSIWDSSSAAWIIRSVVVQQKGEMQKAFYATGKAVELSPDSPDAHLCMASVLSASGQFEQAIEEYKETLQLVEMISEYSMHKKINTQLALAAAYASAGRHSESRDTAEKAIELALSVGLKSKAENVRKYSN